MAYKDDLKQILKKVKDASVRVKIQGELEALLDKINFPENFCKKCGTQMFYNGQGFECTACGLSSASTPEPPPPVAPPPGIEPPKFDPKAPQPEQPNLQQQEMEKSLGGKVHMATGKGVPKRT